MDFYFYRSGFCSGLDVDLGYPMWYLTGFSVDTVKCHADFISMSPNRAFVHDIAVVYGDLNARVG